MQTGPEHQYWCVFSWMQRREKQLAAWSMLSPSINPKLPQPSGAGATGNTTKMLSSCRSFRPPEGTRAPFAWGCLLKQPLAALLSFVTMRAHIAHVTAGQASF